MGLFYYIRCDYVLPDGSKGITEQTKDLWPNYMYHHLIREDGQLMVDNGEDVDVPKAERPYPGAPEGSFNSFAGSMRHVQKLEESTWSGMIEIGNYELLFRKGKVIAVDEAEDPQP